MLRRLIQCSRGPAPRPQLQQRAIASLANKHTSQQCTSACCSGPHSPSTHAFRSSSSSSSSSSGPHAHVHVRSDGAVMQAAVLVSKQTSDAPFAIHMEELLMPVPRANEVLVRVRACGVCHTDLHVMKSEVAFPTPCVMGHEISGEVVELGKGTDVQVRDRLRTGARVISPFIMPCGHCSYCVRGKEDLCETFFAMNRLKGTLYDGTTRLFRASDKSPVWMYSMAGLAQYAVVPATAVFAIPDAVPFAESSIIGCAIFTAYGAIKNSAELTAGEDVVVLGTGGVGANCLQIAKAFGAHRIIAVDVRDDKLEAMKKLGATHVINASKTDVDVAIREITGGRGVDVAIEALGVPKTFVQAINAVVDGGRAIMVGIAAAGTTAPVEITRLVRRQIHVRGSYGARARTDIPAILKMVEKGQIDVASPVTQRFPLRQAGEAYQQLNHGRVIGRAIIDQALQ